MKIALCISGYFNSLTDKLSKGEDGYKYIKKHILDKGDVDVFIYSWDIDKQDRINELYKPKKSVFESQKDFSSIISKGGLDSIKNYPRPPSSVLSHLYSVAESIKMAYESDVSYDLVVKARFDLGRINRNSSGPGKINPHAVQCINFTTNIEGNKIYMANWNHFHMGPADMWFYGSSKIMKEFTNLYTKLESEMYIDSDFHKFATKIENNPGDLSNAIAFYKYWMINNKLWEKRKKLETLWE